MLAMAAQVAGRTDGQTTGADSPFGALPEAVFPAAAGGLEFRGMVQEGVVCWVNLYDPTTRQAHWTTAPGRGPDFSVSAYDPLVRSVTVEREGRRFSLPLRRAGVVPFANLPPSPRAPAGRPLEEDNQARAEFVRTLPAEARRVLEGVRRQRLSRLPAPDDSSVSSPRSP
jgi:hypothetical protein